MTRKGRIEADFLSAHIRLFRPIRVLFFLNSFPL